MVNLGRHLEIDAERSLHAAVEKMIRRFTHIERKLKAKASHPAEATLDEMEALWQDAKPKE